MLNVVYLEMAMTCIAVLLILLYKVHSVLGYFQDRYLFSFVLKLAIISTGLESFTYVFDHTTFYMAETVNEFVNAGYFVVTIVLSFYWLCFIGQLLNIDIIGSRKSIVLLGIPAGISVILSISSIWTGCVFLVDSSNSYMRGDFYVFYVVCNFFYILFASYICMQRVFMKQYYLDREMNLSLVSFAVFPLVAVMVQILWDDATMSSPGIVIALLLCFIMMFASRITSDPLTGLNNKGQLQRFLINRMPNIPRGTKMYLFVINVNKIKTINNEYGYREGDKALVFVSNVLKQVCGPQGCFINRGDEDTFNLAAVMNNDEEAENLIRMLQDAMAERTKKLFYDLTVNVDYASEISETNIPDLIMKVNACLKKNNKRNKEC